VKAFPVGEFLGEKRSFKSASRQGGYAALPLGNQAGTRFNGEAGARSAQGDSAAKPGAELQTKEGFRGSAYGSINSMKIGILFGLFVDAFKVGS
jgi:hypothetical protein